jgi:hypothetical protein
VLTAKGGSVGCDILIDADGSTGTGSTIAVDVAIGGLIWSATGDITIKSGVTIDSSTIVTTGGIFSLLADSDGDNNGDLLFIGTGGVTTAGIKSVSSKISQVVLSGDDFDVDTASTSGIKAGAANVVIQQSVASGASDGSITIGGVATVNAGDLFISQIEVDLIVSTGTITIGGVTTETISVKSMIYGGGSSNLYILALGGLGGSTKTGKVIIITSGASSSTATTTTIESTDFISFMAGFTASGSGGLVVNSALAAACAVATTGAITINSGVTVQTTSNGAPIYFTGIEVELTGGLLLTAGATAVTHGSITMTSTCGNIELGGTTPGSTTATNMMLDKLELGGITCGNLKFIPKSSSGTITVIGSIGSANTATIAGVVTLDASSADAITFATSASSKWSGSFVATAAGIITMNDGSDITTNLGGITLKSSKTSATPAITV